MKTAVVCFNYSTKLTGGVTTSSKILAEMIDADFIALQGRGHHNSLFDSSPLKVLYFTQEWKSELKDYDKIIWINPIEIHRGDKEDYSTRGNEFLQYLDESSADHYFMIHDEDDLPSYLICELFKKFKSPRFIFNCKVNRDLICSRYGIDGTYVTLAPSESLKTPSDRQYVDILSISRLSVDQKYILELLRLSQRQSDKNIKVYGQLAKSDDRAIYNAGLYDELARIYEGRLPQDQMITKRLQAKYTWNLVIGNRARFKSLISDSFDYPFAPRLEISTMEAIQHSSTPILIEETIPDFIPKDLVYSIKASEVNSFEFQHRSGHDPVSLYNILNQELTDSRNRLIDLLQL